MQIQPNMLRGNYFLGGEFNEVFLLKSRLVCGLQVQEPHIILPFTQVLSAFTKTCFKKQRMQFRLQKKDTYKTAGIAVKIAAVFLHNYEAR